MRALINSVTGYTPDVCPAHVFTYPLVVDVLSIYQARESNLLEPITGGWENMSRRVVEGLKHYDRAYRLALAYHRSREQEKAEAEYRRTQSAGRRGGRG